MAVTDERLAALRAQLEVAEHAVADVAEDAGEDVKKAAQKVLRDAQKALSDAHLEAKRAAEKVELETRNALAAAEAEAKRVLGGVSPIQASNQSASTQNVKGTDALSEVERSARRNPKGT
jgi:hypothetical protein